MLWFTLWLTNSSLLKMAIEIVLQLGKSTISMAIFNSELLVYQRVNHSMIYRCWGYLRYEYIDMMVIYTIM